MGKGVSDKRGVPFMQINLLYCKIKLWIDGTLKYTTPDYLKCWVKGCIE